LTSKWHVPRRTITATTPLPSAGGATGASGAHASDVCPPVPPAAAAAGAAGAAATTEITCFGNRPPNVEVKNSYDFTSPRAFFKRTWPDATSGCTSISSGSNGAQGLPAWHFKGTTWAVTG